MPAVIPSAEEELILFLYAVRHVERCPVTDTLHSRPSRWPREKLVKAAGHLRSFLERETLGRVSLNSFIGQYLLLLQFPSDITDALVSGQINVQDAAQLARLTARVRATRRARPPRRIVSVPPRLQGSQTHLHLRVRELLGDSPS